ncbi:hypothetical protein ACOI22_15005 [Glaciecola sp. 2405UD65-10]|uniref:hypothetical protein n=1 Tax=Glaciecola sp. 2405UD65-10 TaxID=3397244 RepID=UPI003B5AAAD2
MKKYKLQYLFIALVIFITLGCKNNDQDRQITSNVSNLFVKNCFDYVYTHFSRLAQPYFFSDAIANDGNVAQVSEVADGLLYEVQFKTKVMDTAIIQDTVSIRCIFEKSEVDYTIILVDGPKPDLPLRQHLYFFKESSSYASYAETIQNNRHVESGSENTLCAKQ